MKKLSKALLTAFALLGAAAPAFADSYNLPGIEPQIYQTNFWYTANPLVPTGVPTGSTVTSVSFSWGYTHAGPLTHAYTLNARLCNGSATTGTPCGQTTSGNVTSTYWTGQAATQPWNFAFKAVSSYNETMKPSALMATTTIQLSVQYDH